MAIVLAFFLALQILSFCRALPTCPKVKCPCSTYKLDIKGCRKCNCHHVTTTTPAPSTESLPVCAEVTCPCSTYKVDINGCRTCDCNPVTTTTPAPSTESLPVCDEVTCPCSTYKVDINGCRTCDCIPVTTTTPAPSTDSLPVCDEVTCPCSTYKVDINGCRTCDCNPVTTTAPAPSNDFSACPEFMCSMFCEFGFVRDSRGCNICLCRSNPCQNSTCADKEVCRADGSILGYVCIPHGNNSHIKEKCDLVCQFGYKKDEEGCDICKCKEITCNGKMCPPGFECGEVTRKCKKQPCDPVIENKCIKVKTCHREKGRRH